MNFIPRTKVLGKAFFTLVLISAPICIAVGQQPLVSAKTYVQYPSLVPVTAVVLSIGQFGTATYSAVETAVKDPNWNCASPDFYKVAVVDKNLKIMRTLEIRAVNLPDRDKDDHPLTNCDGRGHPGVIDLILGSSQHHGPDPDLHLRRQSTKQTTVCL
jgi:hypothetical protein